MVSTNGEEESPNRAITRPTWHARVATVHISPIPKHLMAKMQKII